MAKPQRRRAVQSATCAKGFWNQKFLLMGEENTPSNYLLNVGRTGGGGWATPRHRHTFDQVRYVLKGRYPIAKGVVMEEGSVGYFPESVHYGPQDRPEGLEMMVGQFGGASGQGFLSPAQREAANAALAKKGTFKDGIFTWIDEKGQRHNKDGSEACYEEATGKKSVYSTPRYDDIIIMDPAAYDWVGRTRRASPRSGSARSPSGILGSASSVSMRVRFFQRVCNRRSNCSS